MELLLLRTGFPVDMQLLGRSIGSRSYAIYQLQIITHQFRRGLQDAMGDV